MRKSAIILALGALGFAALVGPAAGPACAGELRYRPINPSFGGDPFNSSHLLGIANAINKFEDPKSSASATTLDATDSFANTIQASVLSRVASQIADQIYGEHAKTSGTAVVGGTTLQWAQVNGQIKLTLNNGKSTQIIELPAY
ncbi:curli assembly protein CsgF [Azospirillum thermophilum]|uniref:Curli production assembly/transport component CsgF n=1 Tax=Azospirillum thermophilum TaxID=2202148 RepID=A0A2S2CVH5_9PROT|nr:curli assembly protein CsgF [Azospirillum thermophilum]AWK88512.1 hypothetical protein DEW08_20850 [Azospirillum thermophilum]